MNKQQIISQIQGTVTNPDNSTVRFSGTANFDMIFDASDQQKNPQKNDKDPILDSIINTLDGTKWLTFFIIIALIVVVILGAICVTFYFKTEQSRNSSIELTNYALLLDYFVVIATIFSALIIFTLAALARIATTRYRTIVTLYGMVTQKKKSGTDKLEKEQDKKS